VTRCAGRSRQLYDTLQDRFRSRATYPLAYRIYHLKQLAYLIHDNRTAIHEAVKADLGGGDFAVDISDVSAEGPSREAS